MSRDVDGMRGALDLCHAYLRCEWGAEVVGASSERTAFTFDPRLHAVWQRGDGRAGRLAWRLAPWGPKRRSARRRLYALLGERAATETFHTDRPIEAGTVLLLRRTRGLVAVRPRAGLVTKVQTTRHAPTVHRERAVLEHLDRRGPFDLSPELVAGGTYADGAHAFVTTRLLVGTSPLPPRAARRALIEALPRLFAFYRSWGVQEVAAADYVASLHALLAPLDAPLAEVLAARLDALRQRAHLRRVALTRVHGDLVKENVRVYAGTPRLLDWGNTVDAPPAFDLFVPFLYRHYHASEGQRRSMLSGRGGFAVSNATTAGLATPFLSHLRGLMGHALDEDAVAFHFLAALAQRVAWIASTRGQGPFDDRIDAALLTSLLRARPPSVRA